MCGKLIYLAFFVLMAGVFLTSVVSAGAPDLAGWWKLDGNAADSSGDHHDGILYGDPKWGAGVIGGALEFDGVDDRVEMPGTSAAAGFPAFEGAVTWAVWFKTSVSGAIGTIMCQGPAGAAHVQGNRSINIEVSGVVMVRAHSVGALTSLSSTAVVNDGEWHHVAIAITFETSGENDSMKVYIDGDLSKGYQTDTVNINQHKGLANDFIVTLGARGTTPFKGSIDDVRIYSRALTESEILAVMEGTEGYPYAYGPEPAEGTIHSDTWVTLKWSAGDYAVSHNVYLGEAFSDVNIGSAETFRGNQNATFIVVGLPGFPYPDGLVPGTSYYWRVDEVNDADPNSPWKGDVWSFSIAPRTAYNPSPADGAEFVDPGVTLSWTAGFGAKLHTVYFGEDFDTVNNATGGLPLGTTTYKPASIQSEKVYYWRIDEFDGTSTYKGSIWAFTTPGAAGNPQPANSAAGVPMAAKLSWTPATNATSHDVYFGTDKDAVKNATTASAEYKGSKAKGSETYDPGKLTWYTPYYWRVDAVYSTGTVKGLVWSFTTANFISIDDFESYNDIDPPDPASNRIFDKWIDGFATPTTNGALVGNDLPPYAEQTVVHSGAQSMPYRYDNTNKTSEATMTLVYPRDWTEEGVTKLSLWYRGASANAAEKMYVALNSGTPVYSADPKAAQAGGWTEWVIDLSSFHGVTLTNVNTISIGFGTKGSPAAGGTGKVYFDDIRLVRP